MKFDLPHKMLKWKNIWHGSIIFVNRINWTNKQILNWNRNCTFVSISDLFNIHHGACWQERRVLSLWENVCLSAKVSSVLGLQLLHHVLHGRPGGGLLAKPQHKLASYVRVSVSSQLFLTDKHSLTRRELSFLASRPHGEC